MPEPIDKRILDFIGEHHLLTLAVSHQNTSWCASCFYVFLPEKPLFVFTSDEDTRHITDFRSNENQEVSGTIALETKMTGQIRGIQFAGKMRLLEGALLASARKAYIKKFPVARLAPLHLWGLHPTLLKFTDNRLGFGKKLYWRDSA